MTFDSFVAGAPNEIALGVAGRSPTPRPTTR
jgi:hypothetical protein